MNPAKNRWSFALGTLGRDMVYTMVSMFLLVYLTEIRGVTNVELTWISTIMLICRIFDALNDPFMGMIVDNTRSPWGKFKPWILFGAISSATVAFLLFWDFGIEGKGFLFFFSVLYLLWGIFYTTNDIAFWSMMPALSQDQKERERIGSLARIIANIGLFTVVASLIPLTGLLADTLSSPKLAWSVYMGVCVIIMLIFQAVSLFGIQLPPALGGEQKKTTLRALLKALFKNDQLLVTAISMGLFMVGYITTTSFGVYYFKYAYGDEDMYSLFAIVLGISQIAALLVFPLLSKFMSRKKLYTLAMGLLMTGYLLFFFAPMKMSFIAFSGILLFVGQAMVQLLMLVFLADTVEYGQWKLGLRNEAVSFAIQPFIYKIGGALGNSIVGFTLVYSGLNDIDSFSQVQPSMISTMKLVMMIFPLLLMLVSFLIYLKYYRLDAKEYERILSEIKKEKDYL